MVVERKKLEFGFALEIAWLVLIFAVIKYGKKKLTKAVVPLLIIFFPFHWGLLVDELRTSTQKFGWGSMHAWSREYPLQLQRDKSAPQTHLILEFAFSRTALAEKCAFTVERVLLRTSGNKRILIDESDGLDAPHLRVFRGSNVGSSSAQISYYDIRFDYVPSDLPLHLHVDLESNCGDAQESHTFSQKLKDPIVTPAIVIFEGLLAF